MKRIVFCLTLEIVAICVETITTFLVYCCFKFLRLRAYKNRA